MSLVLGSSFLFANSVRLQRRQCEVINSSSCLFVLCFCLTQVAVVVAEVVGEGATVMTDEGASVMTDEGATMTIDGEAMGMIGATTTTGEGQPIG